MGSEAPLGGLNSSQIGDSNLQMEWDSDLFDELTDLDAVEDLLQGFKNEICQLDPNDVDLHFDFNSWNLAPWNETGSLCADVLMKPGLQSSTPSRCSASPASSVASPSTHHVPEEFDLPSHSQPSPVSLYTDGINGSSTEPPQVESKQKISAAPAVPVKVSSNVREKPQPLMCKPLLQPKPPVIPSVCISQAMSPAPPNAIIIQPLSSLLPVSKQQPISIQPAPVNGRPVLLSQPTVVQLQAPQLVTTQPVITVAGRTPPLHTLNLLTTAEYGSANKKVAANKPLIPATVQRSSTGADVTVLRRQQRMIKNRESASVSRRKKKEYMLALEERLKAAMSENEKLKKENGSLKQQLDELSSENQHLKAIEPKRRAVCVMVVAVFLMLNFTPISVFQRSPSRADPAVGPVHHSRHLLEFSAEPSIRQETADRVSQFGDYRPASDQKALMVVKEEPLLYLSAPSCQPQINRTESVRLTHELRGWVHRHEVQRTKSRRTSNSYHKSQIVQKSEDKKNDVAPILTVQYTDRDDKISGSELQVYYAPHRNYQDFFEAIHRRGDTFYVVSFRRDHLLLPATTHNKTRRPKMSLVLPAMNVTESVLNGHDYEVMMQIDCEVLDTRILHIKASLIPPFLREHQENQNSSFYRAPSTATHTAPLSAISGSVR